MALSLSLVCKCKCVCTLRASLFCGKMDAFLKRKEGINRRESSETGLTERAAERWASFKSENSKRTTATNFYRIERIFNSLSLSLSQLNLLESIGYKLL